MANFNNSSRYVNTVVEDNRSDQQFLPLRPRLNLEAKENDIFFQVTKELEKRPDLISFDIYGTADLWWVIYEFNEINDPFFDLTQGQILRMPASERVIIALQELEII